MRYVYGLIVILGIAALGHVVFVSAPWSYPVGQTVHIESGATVGEAAAQLQKVGALRFQTTFKIASALLNRNGVHAGTYGFAERESAVALALRLGGGETGLDPVRVTIPEGSTVRQIEDVVGVQLPRSEEGYLFPDTYDFLPGTPSEQIVARMRARYEEKVAPLRERIAASGHTEEEIIIMASILEKEARLPETMKMVSGILWKRIDRGMALQVDAVFGYILDKPTFHPTGDDLEIDSPYNTYLYPGLPPGPISNPGLNAIEAAIDPTESPYLYYLTGADGTMHYAKTFEEHKANRKYLAD